MAGLFNRSVYYSVELSNFLCELDVIMKYSLYFVWHMKFFLFCFVGDKVSTQSFHKNPMKPADGQPV